MENSEENRYVDIGARPGSFKHFFIKSKQNKRQSTFERLLLECQGENFRCILEGRTNHHQFKVATHFPSRQRQFLVILEHHYTQFQQIKTLTSNQNIQL